MAATSCFGTGMVHRTLEAPMQTQGGAAVARPSLVSFQGLKAGIASVSEISALRPAALSKPPAGVLSLIVLFSIKMPISGTLYYAQIVSAFASKSPAVCNVHGENHFCSHVLHGCIYSFRKCCQELSVLLAICMWCLLMWYLLIVQMSQQFLMCFLGLGLWFMLFTDMLSDLRTLYPYYCLSMLLKWTEIVLMENFSIIMKTLLHLAGYVCKVQK